MRSLTKGIAQNVPVRFITFLGRKILRLDRLFNLINRQEYSSTLRTCILHIPLARPLFYLVYYLLLNAMIVKPRGHSLWLVKLPGGPAWLTPDLRDAIDHITVIWRRGIYDNFRLRKGQIVIDAGAHIGIYTVKASKQVGERGTVVAIEPHPANFECLEANLRLNKCTNVIPIRAALASSCGEVNLLLDVSSAGHSVTFGRGDESMSVHSITLDQLMKDLKLTAVHLLKANVEGAMTDVLKGAGETLKSSKPGIVTTVNHYPTEKEEVADLLGNLGFIISGGNDILYAEADNNPLDPIDSHGVEE
jgi:FkbM family methyltransferase